MQSVGEKIRMIQTPNLIYWFMTDPVVGTKVSGVLEKHEDRTKYEIVVI